jgi:hypothetical protein
MVQHYMKRVLPPKAADAAVAKAETVRSLEQLQAEAEHARAAYCSYSSCRQISFHKQEILR